MHAEGDRVLVSGQAIGQQERTAEIIEVMGERGPYRVRFEDDGREMVVAPAPGTLVCPVR